MSFYSNKQVQRNNSLLVDLKIDFGGKNITVPWIRSADDIALEGGLKSEVIEMFNRGLIIPLDNDKRIVKICFRGNIPANWENQFRCVGRAYRLNSSFAFKGIIPEGSKLLGGVGILGDHIFLVKEFLQWNNYIKKIRPSVWNIWGRSLPQDLEQLIKLFNAWEIDAAIRMIGKHAEIKIKLEDDKRLLEQMPRDWHMIRPGCCFKCGLQGHKACECITHPTVCDACGCFGHRQGSSLCKGKQTLVKEKITQVLEKAKEELSKPEPKNDVIMAFKMLGKALGIECSYAQAARHALTTNFGKPAGKKKPVLKTPIVIKRPNLLPVKENMRYPQVKLIIKEVGPVIVSECKKSEELEVEKSKKVSQEQEETLAEDRDRTKARKTREENIRTLDLMDQQHMGASRREKESADVEEEGFVTDASSVAKAKGQLPMQL
jgi:hypothetical protein